MSLKGSCGCLVEVGLTHVHVTFLLEGSYANHSATKRFYLFIFFWYSNCRDFSHC